MKSSTNSSTKQSKWKWLKRIGGGFTALGFSSIITSLFLQSKPSNLSMTILFQFMGTKSAIKNGVYFLIGGVAFLMYGMALIALGIIEEKKPTLAVIATVFFVLLFVFTFVRMSSKVVSFSTSIGFTIILAVLVWTASLAFYRGIASLSPSDKKDRLNLIMSILAVIIAFVALFN